LPRALTRDAILEAAEALFESRGIHNTAVEVVAADAGVTKRTFYNHFLSKDELVAQSLSRRSARALTHLRVALEPAAQDGPAERLATLLTGEDRECRLARSCCGSLASVGIELASIPGHPAHGVIADHRRKMLAILEEWLSRSGVDSARDKAIVVDQVLFSLTAHAGAADAPASAAVIGRIMRAILESPVN
jgi:AcrR family transcriptional regulator